jgi:hypothetical protein
MGFDILITKRQILFKKKMKKLFITSVLAVLVTAGTTVMAQDWPEKYLGLPGDNLNLYAVMKLFQESETLESFERSLNDEKSKINNLDLNGDNLVDYITVNDYVDGSIHTIVLRVSLDRNESQDVAVFTVERFGDGSVQLQLVGDETLYGRNYIIEPYYTENIGETPNPGYTSRNRGAVSARTTHIEINTWPLIRFIFLPDYIAWRSNWAWGYWPANWYAWRPWYWHAYNGYHHNWHRYYYAHFRPWHQHRFSRYDDFYYRSIRVHSPLVNNHIKEGRYKETYSRPESRKDGEALFARSTREQSHNTRENGTVTTRQTRPLSNSQGEPSSVSEGSGKEKAAGTSVHTQRTGTVTSSGRRSEVSGGSRAPESNRSMSTSPENRSANEVRRKSPSAPSAENPGVSRRSSTTISDRPASSPGSSDTPHVKSSHSVNNSGVSRRSPTTVSERPISKSGSSVSASMKSASRHSSSGVVSHNGNRGNKRSSNSAPGNSHSKSQTPPRSSRR